MQTARLVISLVCAALFFGLLAELIIRAGWQLLQRFHLGMPA